VGFSLHSPAAMTASTEMSQTDLRTTPVCDVKSAGAAPQLMCLLWSFAMENGSENRNV